MRLALLADLLPIGMITILQPARGIAPDRLQMGVRIGRIAHLAIRRRHCHRVQAADGAGVADMRAVSADKRIALAALDAADGEFVLIAELEPEFAHQLVDRGLRPIVRRSRLRRRQCLRPLPERLGEFCGRIAGGWARIRKILLIHHRVNVSFASWVRIGGGSKSSQPSPRAPFRGSEPALRVPIAGTTVA